MRNIIATIIFLLIYTIFTNAQDFWEQTNGPNGGYVSSIAENNYQIHQFKNILKSQQDSNITVLGMWPNGPCDVVFVEGNIAYIKNGGALDIIDISNSENPDRVGQIITRGAINEIFVEDNYAYLVNYGRGWRGVFQIIDINNQKSPQEVYYTDLGAYAYDIQVENGYAYIASQDSGLRIIDVSNPHEPEEISRFYSGNWVSNIHVYDSLAFISSNIGDTLSLFSVLNISDPAVPVQVGSLYSSEQFCGGIADIYYYDNFVYVLGGYPVAPLLKIDVTNPASPEVVYTFFPGGRMNEYNRLFIENNYAYMSRWSLLIFDISDTSSPHPISSILNVNDTYVRGNYAYLARGPQGLSILDVTNPSLPIYKGSFPTGGNNNDIQIDGEYAYVADKHFGLRILDVQDPNSPYELSRVDSVYDAQSIDITNGIAYLAAGSNGLKIIDVSDPINPQQIGYYDSDFWIGDVQVVENTLYTLADGHDPNFVIFDVTHPGSPSQIGSLGIYEYAYDIHVSNNYAYIAAGDGGLKVIDVSNPSFPTEVGAYTTQGEARCVFVMDTIALVAGRECGISIVDIGDPFHPQEINHIDSDWICDDIYIYGDYAYISYYPGLRIIDVSNIQYPFEVGYFYSNGHTKSICVKDNIIYLTDEGNGIYILHNDAVSSITTKNKTGYNFTLHQNYPNPFNPKTVIRYALSVTCHLDLSIYNILGQKVATLVNKKQPAGSYQVEWDASGFASGVYLYRLQAGDHIQTEKMILLK